MKIQLSEKVEFENTKSKLKAIVHNKSKVISRRYSKQSLCRQPVQRLERYKAKIKQNENPRGDGNGQWRIYI